MAKFLFTGWPYPGCFNPQMALAHALKARGHTVAFYNGTRTRNLIEREGFAHFAFGQVLDKQIELLLSSPEGIGSRWQSPWQILPMMRAFFLDTVPHQIADLNAILDEWIPNVIVCETAMWGPILILAETRKLAVAVLEYAICTLPGPDVPPPGLGLPPPRKPLTRLIARLSGAFIDLIAIGMRRSANKLRQRYGLSALQGSIIGLYGKMPLLLVPSCPEFDYHRQDLPPSVKYVGHCPWYSPAQGASSSDWLAELPRDQPWVHVTEGTLYAQEPLVLHAAAKGLAHLPIQVIITTGTQRDSNKVDLGRLAPNVVVKTWVAHSDLLPLTDVLVTHGGGGTVVAAAAAGVPMVVVPLMWDQEDNAQRVVQAGAGLRLSPWRCTPGRLRKTVEKVLQDPSYRENARRLSAALKRFGGASQAAELLEGLASPRCHGVSVRPYEQDM